MLSKYTPISPKTLFLSPKMIFIILVKVDLSNELRILKTNKYLYFIEVLKQSNFALFINLKKH